MKKILLALTIFSTAGVCLVALSNAASRNQQQLLANQAAGFAQAQQLAEIQSEQVALVAKVGDLKRELRSSAATTSIDPDLADFLLTNDLKFASPEMQNRVLASFGWGGNSSGSYVLVSKAALTDSNLKPLKIFPNGEKLTDAVRGVLAITPEEQQSVESAFVEAFDALGDWAKANVQREAASGDMLVRYTIPADPIFSAAVSNRLFSSVGAAIGSERGELMRNFYQVHRIDEDGAIGERTNILSIHRISGPAELGYRAGWQWEGSSTINTDPQPIKANRFPYAFLFVFPGGWEELAQRAGFELPKGFQE